VPDQFQHHQSNLPFGFNVVGNITSNTGLGVVARNFVTLLLGKGCPVSILDLDPGGDRTGHDTIFARYAVSDPKELPYCINFFVLQPTALFSAVAGSPQVFLAPGRLNVDLIMWELAVLPKAWLEALKVLDVVAAASDFIGSTFAAQIGNIATVSAPCPLYLPEPISASRSRFGLPDKGTLFVTSFEPNSDIERKNPFAVIAAFQQAFAEDTGARLVIKLNNTRVDGAGHGAVEQLRRSCGARRNIHVIDQVLSYSDVLSLYATCDVFVSLHRSEGLGLGLMEAMTLGKPVIATAWSGNMSFMDHSNSCLVGYDLIPVSGTLSVYRKEYLGIEAVWADPNISEAAAWMKKLVDDEDVRLAIGQKAATDMARYQSNAREGRFIDELRAIWAQYSFLPSRQHRDGLQIRQLWEASATSRPSLSKRFRPEVRRSLEQHILWRFRA
jgi:glycosyltransferase involved in cell wall biosynthesis